MTTRRRLDAELVRRGLLPSTEDAAIAVEAGLVLVSGRTISTPGALVDPGEPIVVAELDEGYVSRGGTKLAAALDRFTVDPSGRRSLDAGASTGGFTDCLLRRGAAHVIAVDVGYGQLDWSLRNDDRVTVLERTHVRDLDASSLPYAPDLMVADLSFISLRAAIPALGAVAADAAEMVLLVKPQFEAGREQAPGGVVRDPAVWREVIEKVADDATAAGWAPSGVTASPLRGPAGNVEFFLHARRGGPSAAVTPDDIEAAIAEGEART